MIIDKWIYDYSPVRYDIAIERMGQLWEEAVAQSKSFVWLLEHPHTYTKGISAVEDDLIVKDTIVHFAKRGGAYAYHGPGQRVIYTICHTTNIIGFVRTLERVVIGVLNKYDIDAMVVEGHTGVWIGDNKIAAIGIGARKWVTNHGVCVNIDVDLSRYHNIVPCGIHNKGITSLKELGVITDYTTFDKYFTQEFSAHFCS